jgi:hypothetical protein
MCFNWADGVESPARVLVFYSIVLIAAAVGQLGEQGPELGRVLELEVERLEVHRRGRVELL